VQLGGRWSRVGSHLGYTITALQWRDNTTQRWTRARDVKGRSDYDDGDELVYARRCFCVGILTLECMTIVISPSLRFMSVPTARF
jgi:hypothetical protein